MSNKPKPSPNSRAADKLKSEQEDLRFVLSAVFDRGDLLKDDKLLSEYLSQDSTLLADSHKVPLHKLEIMTEAGGLVHVGGGGIVIQCTNIKEKTIKYALKIPRPSLFQGKSAKVQENYQAAQDEYLKHAPLSHENVARVFDYDEMSIPDKKGRKIAHNVILMEWIDGATPLNKHLLRTETDYRRVVAVLTQCFTALAYIHNESLIHWDIKSDNFLVNTSGTVKLTDIGNARRTNDPHRNLKAYSTRGNLPEALESVGTGFDEDTGDSSRRVQITLPDFKWDCPWLDLWMLARELNRLFDASPDLARKDWERLSAVSGDLESFSKDFLGKQFPQEDDNAIFAKRFIRTIILRLLYPKTPADRMCYENADAVVDDIGKLLPEFGAAQSIPELQAIPQRVLRVPSSGNTPWTSRVVSIFNGSAIQRLRRHKQLGAVFQVYPGASHLRNEHVAGVLWTTAQYVRALYADRTEPFWRLAVSEKDVNALLLAALLHDVGHIAFGHYIEEMEGLLKGRTHVDYVLRLLGRENDTSAADDTEPAYQEAVERDSKSIREALISNWSISEKHLADFLRHVAEILQPTCGADESVNAAANPDARLDPKLSERLKIDILHSIIDSAIDADKLDYLLRDAHHCGVHYAQGIDVDRFYQSLTAIPDLSELRQRNKTSGAGDDNAHASIGVTHKGLLPVESILVARYQMFSCVYWHHTSRAYTAMLQFLILSYLETANSEAEVSTRLDALIRWFREKDDEGALLSLKDALVDGLAGERRTLFSKIADGILGKDRTLLYRTAFELQYETGTLGPARKTYDGLMNLSRETAGAHSPATYVSFCRTIRQRFMESLSMQITNKWGKTVTFSDGEVLVDIPPAGKDQVNNVFVNTNGQVRFIQELSPLSGAVSDAFLYWVRKARVFLGPTAWEKCEAAGLTKQELWDACFAALQDRVVLQLELPLKKLGKQEKHSVT